MRSFLFKLEYVIIRVDYYIMGDNLVRHLIAALAVAITLLAYYAGYVAGARGWWWPVFGVIIIYGGVYKLVNK